MTHSTGMARLSCLAFVGALLTLSSCAPLQNYGRSSTIALKCSREGDDRRGPEPKAVPRNPVPTTPADSVAMPRTTAAAIKCDGGLPR